MLKKISVSADYCFGDKPIEFSDLAKVNFVYAPNGSGKTTISNALAQQPTGASKRSTWPTAETDFSIRVFNESYRSSILTEYVNGIFTIGEDSAQANAEIEALENGRTERRRDREQWIAQIGSDDDESAASGLKSEILKERNLVKKSVFDHHRSVPEALKEVIFRGFRNDKEKFFVETLRRQSTMSEIPDDLDWGQLDERRSALSGDLSERGILPVLTVEALIEKDEIDLLLRDEVFATDGEFAEFIQRLEISDWVNEGRAHLSDEANLCPFCQQGLPEGFMSKLSGYFAGGYDDILNKAMQVSERVMDRSAQIGEYLVELETQIQRDELIEAKPLSETIEAIRLSVGLIESRVSEKLRHPARSVDVDDVKPMLKKLNALVSGENDSIRKHNVLVRNSSTELPKLIDQGWALFLKEQEVLSALLRYEGQRKRKQQRIDELSKLVEECDQADAADIEAIEGRKNSVSNTVDVAHRINALLHALGFTRFSLQSDGGVAGGYRILRSDGTLAFESLSEGERSFLCFAYYLESLSGTSVPGEAAEPVIAVIDDPISSLDSDTLFIVAAYIRQLAKNVIEGVGNVVQLLVLTHNTQFHHEAAYTVNDARSSDRSHYRMLKGFDGLTTLKHDGTRSMIRGNYDMLWQAVVDIAGDEDESSTSQVGVFNIARRIVEGYFKTVGLARDLERDAKLTVLEERLVSMFHIWASSGSHTIVDGFAQSHDIGGTRRFLQLLQFFFEQQGHGAHFDMMIRASDGTELLKDGSIFGGSLV